MTNVTILTGRITKDLELKQAGQTTVTNFIQVEAWGRNAENIAKYFKKGSKILIQGELKQNRFEDKDGNKREKVYVNVDKFEFLDSKGSNQGQAAPKQQSNDPFANAAPDVDSETLPF